MVELDHDQNFSSIYSKNPDDRSPPKPDQHDAQPASMKETRLRYLGTAVQVVLFASFLMFAYGQLFYYSDSYSLKVSVTIGKWFGVPVTGKGGHSEMVRPMYFFLFCFIPMAVALVLLEFLRHFNLRRISCRFVLATTRFLRLKPRILGRTMCVSLGELLFIAFLIGGNIYVFQYFYRARVKKMKLKAKAHHLDFATKLEIVGLTFGYTCIYNLGFLLLPATRNCVWMEFLNVSYANGIKYHRWLGVIVIVTALVHCICYYWVWIREGEWVENAMPCSHCDLGEKTAKKRLMNFFGQLALLVFFAIGLTSIPWVRRKFFNVFYYVHHLFIVAIILIVLHWNPVLSWIYPSVMLYAICRAISSSNGFTPVAVRELTTLSHDVVKVVINRSTSPAGDFKVGQFVYLNVPSISKLQWHPFTISSSPRSSSDTLTVLLKSLGDWTEELVKYSDDCKRNNVLPTVYMDGYYGASLEAYDEHSTVCLIGGGIGVTPMLAILEDLVAKLHQGAPKRQKVFFIFSFRELSLLEEIHPLLMQIKELDPQERFFSLHFSLTRAPTDAQLDLPIDHQRLAGKPHDSAMHYDKSVTSKAPQPFAEPLRFSATKLAMYTLSLFLTLLIWTIVRYGNKIQVKHAKLWALQNFVEILVLAVVAVVTVYAFALIEKKLCTGASGALVTPSGGKPYSSTAQTFRDLIAEYRVTVGHRLDIAELMHQVFNEHSSRPTTTENPAIGVFMSGPKALKASTEKAITDIGVRNFDVHEEEFDL